MKKYIFLIIGFLWLGLGVGRGQYKDLLTFNTIDGYNPYGSLTLFGNVLYGMANNGGAYGGGVIFSINTNGGGFKILYNFTPSTGKEPWGDLTVLGGKLYGTTYTGGTSDSGCIFSIDTNGSGYRDLFNFSGVNGANPPGSLTLAGNKLWGLTTYGGVYHLGCIFSIDTNGNNYSDRFDFNGANGGQPWRSLTLVNDRLYGMTYLGGAGDWGNIFSIDTNGSGFKVLLDFDRVTNGARPKGNLTYDGNLFYGMASDGGVYNLGCVFSIDTNGNRFRDLYNFSGPTGYSPPGSLAISRGIIFGMTPIGSEYYDYGGTVFSIDTNGSNFTNLFNFNGNIGDSPNAAVTVVGNSLFGMTVDGGTNRTGNIFWLGNNCDIISVSTTNFICPAIEGSATANVIWGNPPYTYLWSPGGQTNTSITGLSAGSYRVTVTDSMGCVNSDSIYIANTPTVLSINCSISNIAVGDSTYLFSYCSIPATFSWTPAISVTNPTSQNSYAHPLSNTTYTCIAVTACGTYVDSVKVGVSCFDISLTSTSTTCPIDTGTASVTAISGVAPFTYLWSPGGQTNATATGLSAGTYSINVIDSTGCSVTGSVSVASPLISFYVLASADTAAAGSPVVLTANCSGTATYLWSNGATTSSITVNDTVTTTYTCTANIGCGNKADSVTIVRVPFLCPNNFNVNICIVTIDTASRRNEVIWDRAGSPPDGYYNIYKETTSASFSLIATQPLTSLSEYIDTSSRPWLGSSTYEVATVDSCGESTLSLPHTTIFLTTTASFNAYNLSWTSYVGFTPLEYRIFRGPAINAMTQIDSVPNTSLTFVDSFPPLGSFYAIEAVKPSGVCIPTMSIRGHRTEGAMLSGSFSNGFNTGSIVTGIQTLSSISNLSIFPNPSNGQFTVGYSLSGNGYVRFSLIDELGQVVYDNTAQKTAGHFNEQLNLESLASGIYTLRMQTSGGTTVKKVVIMKK